MPTTHFGLAIPPSTRIYRTVFSFWVHVSPLFPIPTRRSRKIPRLSGKPAPIPEIMVFYSVLCTIQVSFQQNPPSPQYPAEHIALFGFYSSLPVPVANVSRIHHHNPCALAHIATTRRNIGEKSSFLRPFSRMLFGHTVAQWRRYAPLRL
jgi:hypothetical protein